MHAYAHSNTNAFTKIIVYVGKDEHPRAISNDFYVFAESRHSILRVISH